MTSCRFRLSSIIHPCTIGLLGSLIVVGCATQGRKPAIGETDPCRTLDSLYESSGFEKTVSMSGKITFDVEQYRIRGQFTLTANPSGGMGFDFSTSALFGNQHEDISMSTAGGVVRVLDRERGRYYEGEEVDELLKEMVGLDLDVGEIVSLVLGAMPPCGDLQEKRISLSRNGDVVFASRSLDEGVRIVFGGERRTIRKIEWPISFADGKITPLLADYDWENDDGGNRLLKRLVLSVSEKGWRIKLVSV